MIENITNCDNIHDRHVFVFSAINTKPVIIEDGLCSCGKYSYKNGTLEKTNNIYQLSGVDYE